MNLKQAEESKNNLVYETMVGDVLNRRLIYGNWAVDKEKGLYHRNKDIVACPVPILPSAIYRNTATGTEKVELQLYKFGEWRKIVTDRETISNRSKIISLSNLGVEVNSGNAGHLMNALSEIISQSLSRLPLRRSCSSLGWSGDEFIPYSGNMVFDGEEQFKSMFDSVTQKGGLEDWRRFMAPLRENRVLRIMLAASFASPLVSVVGENPFILHLWGGTSLGKTVALMCAMSVWGDPAVGHLTRTLNMTNFSMLSTAAFLNSLPFAADELQTIKKSFGNYDNLIMQLTEGTDRARMKYDRLNYAGSWRNAFLFTGEEPCIKPGSGGGAKNRVIEIECREKIIENGNATANFVRSCYGTAGKEFIEKLDRRMVKSYYDGIFNDIVSGTSTTEKQAGAAALILTADWLSTQQFWPEDESVLRIDDLEPYLFTEEEVDTAQRAYGYVLDLVSEYGRNFTADAADRWGVIENYKVYFIKSVLERELEKAGFDFNAVKAKWYQHGWLEKANDGGYRLKKRVNGTVANTVVIYLQDK